MNSLLHNLEESLREELRCYGGLLTLLETERRQVTKSLLEELLATISDINAQTEAIQAVSNERAQRQSELAQALGLDPGLQISKVIPALPQAHQPLVAALVHENTQLLRRVKEVARQNHLMLCHAVGLMEHFIRALSATGRPPYDEAGAKLQPATGHGR